MMYKLIRLYTVGAGYSSYAASFDITKGVAAALMASYDHLYLL